MYNATNGRGFQSLTHPPYTGQPNRGADDPRLVAQSSAIGDYPDSFDKPGSSYLWFGEHHHLSREQVAELVKALQHWLETGRLFETEEKTT